jgi:hypothetical protein
MDDLGDSGSACIARAQGLIPLLAAAADRIEAANELPPDVLDAMFDAGMFKLLLPRAYGGFELRPLDYIQCVEAIAQGDASVAWCMNQGTGCSMASAYVSPEVAREIWGGKRDVVASPVPGVSPAAPATPPGSVRCVQVSPPMARPWSGRMANPGTTPSCSGASRRGSTTYGR